MQELEKILEEIESRIEYLEKIKGKYEDGNEKMAIWFRIDEINRIKKIIRKYMNNRWIPVEKDLPKNESEVWVILESTYDTGYRTYSSARYLYFENYGESHWCDNHYGYLEWDRYSDGHGGSSEYKVIAWKPIEPYRPERSDNHGKE